jgi:hypothetical protein
VKISNRSHNISNRLMWPVTKNIKGNGHHICRLPMSLHPSPMRPTCSSPTLLVTDINYRQLPLNFVVTGYGMSVTIYGSRTRIFPSIQLTLQCPSTRVRPIQPLSSGVLSIHPALSHSPYPSCLLPHEPPGGTPLPCATLWAGGAPLPSTSPSLGQRRTSPLLLPGVVPHPSQRGEPGSSCVNIGILGCAGPT